MTIETKRGADGRWLAALPGVLAYGMTEADARHKVMALARCVIADRIAAGKSVPAISAQLMASPDAAISLRKR